MNATKRRPTLEELRAVVPSSGKYAAQPGTGPAGATCRTCQHKVYSSHNAKHPKCGLTQWTCGDATTIRTSTAACKLYDHEDVQPHTSMNLYIGRTPR